MFYGAVYLCDIKYSRGRQTPLSRFWPWGEEVNVDNTDQLKPQVKPIPNLKFRMMSVAFTLKFNEILWISDNVVKSLPLLLVTYLSLDGIHPLT